jgi:hypothetical protein
LHWIGKELCDPPRYEGLNDIRSFIKVFESYLPEHQRLLALDVVLKATPARWWVAHKKGMEEWLECRRLIQVRFDTKLEIIAKNYTRVSDPVVHVEQCKTIWSSVQKRE